MNRTLHRRRFLTVASSAMASVASGVAVLADVHAAQASGRSETTPTQETSLPDGYAEVDPRTALRVPLTQGLRVGEPTYPGDPAFEYDPAYVDTRTPTHDDGGYLLERVTSMGTHSASHISAPVHFVLGGRRLSELDERFTLMPLAVIDVRGWPTTGAHSQVRQQDLERWERRNGRIPAGGCVLLLTGAAELWGQGSGETSPYVTTPVPGFAGSAVDWLFTQRGILATGSDSLGPDASSDPALQATTRTLVHDGITLENVGTGLARMRPYGDWIGVNGNRPAFSGFPMGFTGFTLP